MISASWCEPSRRRHFLLADWQSLKTIVSAVMRLRQPLVLVAIGRLKARYPRVARYHHIDYLTQTKRVTTHVHERGDPRADDVGRLPERAISQVHVPIRGAGL